MDDVEAFVEQLVVLGRSGYTYQTGLKIPDNELKALGGGHSDSPRLPREWNYTQRPQT